MNVLSEDELSYTIFKGEYKKNCSFRQKPNNLEKRGVTDFFMMVNKKEVYSSSKWMVSPIERRA